MDFRIIDSSVSFDTTTTNIYTLSLHDALPISRTGSKGAVWMSGSIHSRPVVTSSVWPSGGAFDTSWPGMTDRKSTRLNSSHVEISYAVFCLKKKKQHQIENHVRNRFPDKSFLR